MAFAGVAYPHQGVVYPQQTMAAMVYPHGACGQAMAAGDFEGSAAHAALHGGVQPLAAPTHAAPLPPVEAGAELADPSMPLMGEQRAAAGAPQDSEQPDDDVPIAVACPASDFDADAIAPID